MSSTNPVGSIIVLSSHSVKLMVRTDSEEHTKYPELDSFGNFLELEGAHICVRALISSSDCKGWEFRYPRKESNCSLTDFYRGWLPLSYLMGKKEGDVFDIVIYGKSYTLKCANTDFGYENFEDSLYHMTASFGGIHCDTKGEPCRLEQMLHIYNAHVAYAKSIIREPIYDEEKFQGYNRPSNIPSN